MHLPAYKNSSIHNLPSVHSDLQMESRDPLLHAAEGCTESGWRNGWMGFLGEGVMGSPLISNFTLFNFGQNIQ